MLNALFRPIERWPKKQTARRQKARFSAGYQTTLEDLDRELKAVHARHIIVQLDLPLAKIRNDGWPYSNAVPDSPRVILTFTKSGNQTVSMPCDTYSHWLQNLRAITLTLHNLRMIDQYGVTSHGEQYQGFAQIEAPPQEQQNHRANQIQILAYWAQVPFLSVRPDLERVFTQARRRAHPDSGIGNHEAFIEVNKAYEALSNGAV